ncbi:MAG: VWA domain-containing protein, partial [Pseudomonadota bacterium]
MKFSAKSRRALMLSACLSLAAAMSFGPAIAQDASPPEDEDDYNAIIVTGARVTQGGAQDVKHFRSIALDEFSDEGLPRASSFTAEGLLSEHDLILPSKRDCAQLFCVTTHAMPATRADDAHFVGIGFESGIDADAYRAEPLSLIALVDRSGSMSGAPIERVKEALHAIIDQMREGDRLGMVIYGSDTRVHQHVIDVAGNKQALHAAVDAIAINGATSMEAGMRLGFKTAFAELAHSRGKTRMMLFTDENPNVGDTSAEGFMAQAIDGSRKGVGLTTIGVGAHFDGALATKV